MGDREENDFLHGIMPQSYLAELAVSIIADFVDKSSKLPRYDMWDPRFDQKTRKRFTQSEPPSMERLQLVPLNWKGHSVLIKVVAVDDPCGLTNQLVMVHQPAGHGIHKRKSKHKHKSK